jgi:signal transduction histidine kinase
VLFVEDVERDAMLVVRELVRGGFDVDHQCVDTPETMSAALEQGQPWDLIVSDYTMPRFSAPAALHLLQTRELDVPFILVSGSASEEIAVEMLHAGAHDFIAKGRLGRLVPAITRERANVAVRAEQRKMQGQLMIAERMASMGMLAAGVVHEINNPLACVIANLDLAARELEEKSRTSALATELQEVREELYDAQVASQRIRNVVRDLKLFSRSEEEAPGAVDVQAVMESTLRMAANEVRHRARLVKNYEKTPLAQASGSRLGQVFLNLIVNAAQAIVEGRAEQNEIRITTSTSPSGAIVIEIADTGSGMSPEVLKRLFTPFFTTKPQGMGTGLGLSICQRIIADFGGSIEVTSSLGSGTTFRIALAPAGAEATRVTGPPPLAVFARRRGRILVVDDEPMIAKVVQRILSPEHEVVTTGSAAEALRQIEAGQQFDLVLCDLMMPQMTGMDLHAELSKVALDHAARMIFLTGGAFTPSAREFLDSIPNQCVDKPFHAGHLRELINGFFS